MPFVRYQTFAGGSAQHIGSFELLLDDSGAVAVSSRRVVGGVDDVRRWRARVDGGLFGHLISVIRELGPPPETTHMLAAGSSGHLVVVEGTDLDGWVLHSGWSLGQQLAAYVPLVNLLGALVEQVSDCQVRSMARVPLPLLIHDRKVVETTAPESTQCGAAINPAWGLSAVSYRNGRVAIRSFAGEEYEAVAGNGGIPVGEPLIAWATINGIEGPVVVAGTWDGAVWAWDTKGNVLIPGWGTPLGAVRDMTALPRGMAAIAGEAAILVWDAVERREVWRSGAGANAATAVAADVAGDDLLVTAGDDGLVRVWDPRSGQQRQALAGHNGWVDCLVSYVQAETGVVASGGQDGVVRVWHLEGQERRASPGGEPIRVLHQMVVGGRGVVVSGHSDGTVRLCDDATAEVIGVASPAGAGVECLASAVMPDGQGGWLAAGRRDGRVDVWLITDDVTGFSIQPVDAKRPHKTWVVGIDVVVNVRGPIITSGGMDGTWARWQPGSDPVVEVMQQPLTLARWDDDSGSVHAWGTTGGWVILRQADGRSVVLRQSRETGVVTTVEYGGRRFLVAGGASGVVSQWDITDVWEMPSPPFVRPVSGHRTTPVVAGFAALTDDTAALITVSSSDTMRIWHGNTGQTLVSVDVESLEVRCAALGQIHDLPVVALGTGHGELWTWWPGLGEGPTDLPDDRPPSLMASVRDVAITAAVGDSGSLVAVAGTGDLHIYRYDPDPLPDPVVFPSPKDMVKVAFGMFGDRQVLVGAAYDGSLYAIDAHTGTLVWQGAVPGKPLALALDDMGRVFVIAGNQVHVVEPRNGHP